MGEKKKRKQQGMKSGNNLVSRIEHFTEHTGQCTLYPLTWNYSLIIMPVLKMGRPESTAAQ